MNKAPALPVADDPLIDQLPNVPCEFTVGSIVEAEELLDWLESQGVMDARVRALDATHFLVSCHSL